MGLLKITYRKDFARLFQRLNNVFSLLLVGPY